MCCAQGECIAGLIGAAQVTESEWEKVVKDFDLVNEDWDERTLRFAIPRPGYVGLHQLWKEAGMTPEQRAAIPMPGADITCTGKGGHCYVLGIAKGAGTSRQRCCLLSMHGDG